MSSIHLVCPQCDAVVRVPAERLSEGPGCPKCHVPLLADHPLDLSTTRFEKHVSRHELPLVVDFWAPWCGPCRMMAPHFEEVSRRLSTQARFIKINSDDESALSGRFGIRGIPTLIAFKNGKEVARQSGAMETNSLMRWVTDALAR